MKIDRVCENCGKTFQVDASRVKHGRGRNCSPTCGYASITSAPKPHRIKFSCIGCGVEFDRNPSWLKRRGAGKYCTRSCRDKHWVGDKNPNWQNGDKVYKRGPRWFSIRRRMLARDGACVSCGATEKLHVHHVVPFRMFAGPDEANVYSNLVTLCPPCHRRADAQFKWVRLPDSGTVISMNACGAAWELARERGII